MQSLVVFSHLRWGVAPRLQHLVSKFADHWRVVVVEEPVTGASHDRLETSQPRRGIHVWQPHMTGSAEGFHAEHAPVLQRLLADALREHAVRDSWAWLTTPLALPLVGTIRPRGVVYDCVEDLSHLPGAAAALVQCENALFKVADLVFAGGRSLYNDKRSRHPDVHCFPAGVDAAHFRDTHGVHPLHDDIPRPRLGFCGVIDGRINLGLVDAIAKERPEWNIVMAGPVCVDTASLPRRDNIHWLGAQPVAELPKFIKGWDVGLMPFALTDATRTLHPPQALEYMACGTPVVGTSIRDVVESHGEGVRIADTPEGFIADCEMIMARDRDEREAYERECRRAVARASWDDTADAMAELIAQADELVDAIGCSPLQRQPMPFARAPSVQAQGA